MRRNRTRNGRWLAWAASLLVLAAPGHAAQPASPAALLQAGDAQAAAQLAEQLLFGAAGPAPALFQEAYNVWTDALAALGDVPACANAWQRKTALARQKWGDNSLAAGLAALQWADMLQLAGRASEAEQPWRAGIGAVRALATAGDAGALDVLTLAARLANDAAQRKTVTELMEPTLQAMQGKLDSQSPQHRALVRQLLMAVANLHVAMGRGADAIAALTMAVQFVGPDQAAADAQVAEIAAELAAAHSKSGNFAKARQFAEYAIGKLEPQYGAGSQRVAALRRRLAFALLQLGDRAGALASLDQTLAARRQRQATLAQAALPAAVKAARYNATFFDDELHFALAMERALADAKAVPALVELELLRKGALLDTIAPRHHDSAADSPPTAKLRGQLAAAANLLAQAQRQAEMAPSPQAERQRAEMAERRNQLEAALAASEHRPADRRAPQTLAELCAAMPARSALIDYVQYVDYRANGDSLRLQLRFAAIGIAKASCAAKLVDLGERLPLVQQIARWRSELRQSAAARGAEALGSDATATATEAWRPGARQLYGQLLAPFEPLLAGSSVVAVSPDDDLHFVPFAALVGSDGRFAGERCALAVVDAPRALEIADAPPAGKSSALVIGDAAFGTGDQGSASKGACAAFRATQWPPLPGTRAESDQTAALLAKAGLGVTLKQGAAATEATFKAEAGRHRYLALATHGYFAPHACGALPGEPTAEPLLLSGLVFAGANTAPAGGEDGWLSAAELATLDLRHVDLAVLSACETGLGDNKHAIGDGVFGLRRALGIAGAGGAVMSLWQVADQPTAALMGEFWRALTQCRGDDCRPYRALGKAQAWMRQRGGDGFGHPYFWAGFVYSGKL